MSSDISFNARGTRSQPIIPAQRRPRRKQRAGRACRKPGGGRNTTRHLGADARRASSRSRMNGPRALGEAVATVGRMAGPRADPIPRERLAAHGEAVAVDRYERLFRFRAPFSTRQQSATAAKRSNRPWPRSSANSPGPGWRRSAPGSTRPSNNALLMKASQASRGPNTEGRHPLGEPEPGSWPRASRQAPCRRPQPRRLQRTLGHGHRGRPHQSGTPRGLSPHAAARRAETRQALLGEDQPDLDALGRTRRPAARTGIGGGTGRCRRWSGGDHRLTAMTSSAGGGASSAGGGANPATAMSAGRIPEDPRVVRRARRRERRYRRHANRRLRMARRRSVNRALRNWLAALRHASAWVG